MRCYGYIPLAAGKTEEIYNLQKAIGGCFATPFEVEDVKGQGISALYAGITNSNTEQFENYFRPSMVYVTRAFIDRYGLSCDGGEYHGYVEPDPNKLATLSSRTVEECIKWKNIDEIFGKTGSEKSLQ
ncbi:MAG: hypothetical protein J6J33_03115 [Clostridia bacterium]|nr:hypothetical protein [Clostridia bacterium]